MIFKWGASEASAAKKRKLGQRFRPEYSSLALWNQYGNIANIAYCKYCKQDLSIQHGGQEIDRSFSTIDSPENP
jgi:hypothetical protein